VGFLHEAFDGLGVLVVGLGLEEVTAADDAGDVVEVFAENGEAAKGDVGVQFEDFADGDVAGKRGDDGKSKDPREVKRPEGVFCQLCAKQNLVPHAG